MAATEGPEDRLGVEFLATLQGRELPSKQWQDTGDDAAKTLRPGYSGSCNIPLLSAAVTLYQEAERSTIDNWLDFFEQSKLRFMGIEAGSRIYGAWHVLSVAAVGQWANEHKDPLLEAAALDWLQFALDCLKRCEAPDGTLLLVGQRSAGHPPTRGLMEWIFAQSSTGDQARAEGWCRDNGVGLRKRWEYAATLILLPTLRRAWTYAIPVQPHEFLSPYHCVREAGTMAVWTERNLNPNTPPILGVVWTPSETKWLPDGGGERIREKFDQATCELASDGRTLIYESSLYGHQEIRLPAPSPAPAGGPISPPANVPSPAPVEPSAPKPRRPWWQRIFW